MMNPLLLIFTLCSYGQAVQTDPYQSSDNNVRLAKQRLLSMDPKKPGIRYRVGDQLTNLVDVDGSIKNLEGSVDKFQTALAKVAGIIDMTRVNEGLVPQMEAVMMQIRTLDSKLMNLHKRASAQISNLYSKANAIPKQLTTNLQRSLDGLISNYNQQIINQVGALDRQRKSAISQATSDANTLSRTVKGVQLSQIVDAKKLIKQIQIDRSDILTKSLDLNTKFNAALGVVKTALAGVKDKSQSDLIVVEGIVNANKKGLVDYINQAGETWTGSFENLIAKAAKDSAKSLGAMSKDLSSQFNAAKKKATDDLSKVDSVVDEAVGQVNRQIASVSRKFDLAIQNATQSTDAVVADLRQPVLDVQDQVAAAGNLLATIQRQSSMSIAGIASSTTKSTQSLLAQYQKGGQAIEGNPGFSAVAAGMTNVYNSATADISTAQANAESRVAALEEQLGSNDKSVGEISSILQEGIQAQKSEFARKTQLSAAAISNSVHSTSGKLTDLASQNAAKVDELKAASDGQLAEIVGGMGSRISANHDRSIAQVAAANDKIASASANLNTLIAGAFGGVLADGEQVKEDSAALAKAAESTGSRVRTLSSALAGQTGLVTKNLQNANAQVADLRQLGGAAVDDFYHQATAETADSVGGFARDSNAAVDAFAAGLNGQYASLLDAQRALQNTQDANTRQTAQVQAGLAANVSMAKNLLASLKSNSSMSDSAVRNQVAEMLAQFKRGSLGEVANLKAATAARLKAISAELQGRVDTAGSTVANQTKGLLGNLAQLSEYLGSHSKELDASVTNTSGAVSDFGSMVDSMVAQIASLSDNLKLLAQNSTSYMAKKVQDTQQFLNESRDDALDEIDETWATLRGAMNAVDGSTSQKIALFKQAVNSSIATSDSTIQNFTNYIASMVEYEKKSAASRIAIQRGLLQSIMAQAVASDSKNGNSDRSKDMLNRLKAVLSTASDSVGSSADQQAAQKASQDAMINMFGVTTAEKVDALLKKLDATSTGFVNGVGSASAASAADSKDLLRSTGLGVQGIVDLASNVAESVDIALNDTRAKMRDSQVAMAALSAETGDLSNITEAQLSAVLQAMMASQTMYSSQLDSARGNNSANIALISGVVRDFVTLVNQTLAESNDLISTVDANYTDASMKLGAKMDTIIGFISRQANAVSASADSSAQMLKQLLISNGPMEDGIRETLTQLSGQQDAFAKDVHDKLQGFASRLSDDTAQMSSARVAATNKLYDALHRASEEFASNAAAWQSQKLSSALIQMSDEDLVRDAQRHLQQLEAV